MLIYCLIIILNKRSCMDDRVWGECVLSKYIHFNWRVRGETSFTQKIILYDFFFFFYNSWKKNFMFLIWGRTLPKNKIRSNSRRYSLRNIHLNNVLMLHPNIIVNYVWIRTMSDWLLCCYFWIFFFFLAKSLLWIKTELKRTTRLLWMNMNTAIKDLEKYNFIQRKWEIPGNCLSLPLLLCFPPA